MSSLVIILCVSLALFSTTQANLISDLCSKSINPSLCSQVIGSDPRSRGANAQVLASLAIDKAEAAINNSIRVAKSVTNRSNKHIIETCIENFGEAVDNLKECKPLINKRNGANFGDLQAKGSAALTDIDTCRDEFGGKEPRQLNEATEKAGALVELLLIIAKVL